MKLNTTLLSLTLCSLILGSSANAWSFFGGNKDQEGKNRKESITKALTILSEHGGYDFLKKEYGTLMDIEIHDFIFYRVDSNGLTCSFSTNNKIGDLEEKVFHGENCQKAVDEFVSAGILSPQQLVPLSYLNCLVYIGQLGPSVISCEASKRLF